MEITLRPADAEDPARIAQIWYDGWQQAHRGRVPDALVAIRTRESFDRRAIDLLSTTTVAVVDGAPVGFVMIEDDEVTQVYVADQHRGAGVADALLTEAERRIAAAGHGRAWLAVVAENERARRFYQRRGWQDAGRFDHQAPGPDGPVSVPAHRYVKNL